MQLLEADALDDIVQALRRQGFRTIGPVLRDGCVGYAPIDSAAELVRGRKDEQSPGSYRLVEREDDAFFGYVPGSDSWKPFLHPPQTVLFEADLQPGRPGVLDAPAETVRQAFIGVRPCELQAIAILDRVMLEGPYVDPGYGRRRAGTFIVAVNCTEPGTTCFCASLGTGPAADGGYDLLLTELCEPGGHRFVCVSGSDRGSELLGEVPHREAPPEERAAAERRLRAAAASMGRSLCTAGLKELLQSNPDHPHWEAVAERCMACANCTMVCPTCFCTDVADVTDLDRGKTRRLRGWDSCFSRQFSYIHGGCVRQSGASRYRQWMTHKLASWVDQFDRLGCVGCGRCITWCPVGIDITEEAAALRAAVDPSATAGE
jgi:ferredoxin